MDYGTFARGGTVFPLTSSLTNTLLKDADPSLYQAAAFLAGVLQIHIGTRLIAAAAAAGVTVGGGAAISNAVMQFLPYDPRPALKVEQGALPMLALWRETEKYEQRTVALRHSVGKWGALYALPPMSPAQTEQLHPILRAAGNVLDDRVRQGMDPAFVSGTGAAASIAWDSTTGTSTISGLSGMTAAGHVGAYITITGAATSGNNATLQIASVVAADTVTVLNPSGATDANNGALSWAVSGARVWALAGLEEIEVVSGAYGNFTGDGFATNLFFPAWCGEIAVKERVMPVTGAFGVFAGADTHEDIKASDGTTVDDVVVTASDVVVPGPG